MPATLGKLFEDVSFAYFALGNGHRLKVSKSILHHDPAVPESRGSYYTAPSWLWTTAAGWAPFVTSVWPHGTRLSDGKRAMTHDEVLEDLMDAVLGKAVMFVDGLDGPL